jgi:hypothetical protein
MAVDPIRPIEAREDLAAVTRVQLTRVERDEQRREREQRRKRRQAAPKPASDGGHGSIDVRA